MPLYHPTRATKRALVVGAGLVTMERLAAAQPAASGHGLATSSWLLLALLVAAMAAIAILSVRLRAAVAQRDRARRRRDALVENVDEIIAVLDEHGAFKFANPSLRARAGRRADELPGLPLIDLVHRDDIRRVREFLAAIRSEGTARLECRLVRPDGTDCFIEAVGKDLTQDEDIDGIVINAWDVTERNAARNSLMEEKERAVVTLRSMGEAVFAADTEGRVRLMNYAAERLTGWSQSEAEGKQIADVLMVSKSSGEDDGPPSRRSLASTGARDYTLVTRSGEERLVAHAMAPIQDGNKAYGVVFVLRDVTEQRRLEREATRVQQLESLGILAGGIAHDFNNLLAAILGNTSLAREETVDPSVQALLDEACKATERAAGLAHQLLTFAKGGAPVKTSASLRDIVRDTATFVLHGSRASLKLDIADDLYRTRIDANQISQVVQNLALNASQAMPQGGGVHVVVENVTLPAEDGPTLPAGRYVRVSVRDEGCGIAPEDLDRVFHPFFTTKTAGHGLGLATSHSIIKQHDGHISVESTLGAGTTFTFYLPAGGEVVTPAPAAVRDNKPLSGRILVMDDNRGVRTALVRILHRLGFETVETADGIETVDAVRSAAQSGERFAAVILDLTVPGGPGGLEILPSLRSVAPELRVIASSGYATNEVMADHAAHGFNAVLPKPYTAHQVRNVVRSVLSAHS